MGSSLTSHLTECSIRSFLHSGHNWAAPLTAACTVCHLCAAHAAPISILWGHCRAGSVLCCAGDSPSVPLSFLVCCNTTAFKISLSSGTSVFWISFPQTGLLTGFFHIKSQYFVLSSLSRSFFGTVPLGSSGFSPFSTVSKVLWYPSSLFLLVYQWIIRSWTSLCSAAHSFLAALCLQFMLFFIWVTVLISMRISINVSFRHTWKSYKTPNNSPSRSAYQS